MPVPASKSPFRLFGLAPVGLQFHVTFSHRLHHFCVRDTQFSENRQQYPKLSYCTHFITDFYIYFSSKRL